MSIILILVSFFSISTFSATLDFINVPHIKISSKTHKDADFRDYIEARNAAKKECDLGYKNALIKLKKNLSKL